jgi:predicted negative regulator of RcsB-dependent stress response
MVSRCRRRCPELLFPFEKGFCRDFRRISDLRFEGVAGRFRASFFMDQPKDQPKKPGITIDEIALWVESNRKPLLAGVLMIGVLGLAYVISSTRGEATEHRATAALFQLQAGSTGSTNEPAATDYRGIAAQTEGTGIAQHVKLREATALFTAGNYAEAQRAFEEFTRSFPESPFLPEANLGTAASLEAQGKSAEALASYQELTTRFPQSWLVNRARLGVARLHEAQGDPTQAFRIYQDLVSQAGMGMSQFRQPSPWQIDANIALRRLVKENPALLQTNEPALNPAIAPGSTTPPTTPTGNPATSQQHLLTDPSSVPLPNPNPNP